MRVSQNRQRATVADELVIVEVPERVAAALLAVAVAYGASAEVGTSKIAVALDAAVSPLRDVVRRRVAQDAELALKDMWRGSDV